MRSQSVGNAAYGSVPRAVSSYVILVLCVASIVAIAWWGARGEVPWGYNSSDHFPIWRQYLLLSVAAIAVAAVYLLGIAEKDLRAHHLRASIRLVGAGLFVVMLVWFCALCVFGLWGSVTPRAVTLAIAASAPALALSTCVMIRGYTRGRLAPFVVALAILGIGAIGTGLTLTMSGNSAA